MKGRGREIPPLVIVTWTQAVAFLAWLAFFLVSGHPLGVTGTGMQTTALTMAPAAYVNAIRRMSAVIAVVLGRALFREADVGRRLVAALLACAGAACLLLAN